MRNIEFKVIETDPAKYSIGSLDPVIHNSKYHNFNTYLLTHLHLYREQPGQEKRQRDKLWDTMTSVDAANKSHKFMSS
jgi:hypothetical protein